MIDTPEQTEVTKESSMRMYTTKEVIAELGLKSSQYYDYRTKGLFLTEGVQDGANKVFSAETLALFKQELSEYLAAKVNSKQEHLPVTHLVVSSPVIMEKEEEEPTTQVSVAPSSPDPIAQAITLLQQSMQNKFDRQQMIQDVREMRGTLGSLLNAMDEFLERWD